VQFNTNGGSAVANQTIKRGGKITKPENPTKEEYTFLGWYADKYLSTAFNFETAVEKSMTLYAKWQKDEQTPDVPQWNNPFTDVKETDWFYENVKYAVINGLMNGTTDTAFEPNSPLTRAMLVTVLWRPDGKPLRQTRLWRLRLWRAQAIMLRRFGGQMKMESFWARRTATLRRTARLQESRLQQF
jgi:uncharacterized repeat protein (TIGR02543 family)